MARNPESLKNLRPGNKRGPGLIGKTLKEAILAAAEGQPGGTVGYLSRQAEENPVAFMGLLGKVLPLQVQGDPNAPLAVSLIRRTIVDPHDPDAPMG